MQPEICPQLVRFPMFRWHQSKLFPNEQYPWASSYFEGISWPQAAPQVWIPNTWLSSDLQSPRSVLFEEQPAHLAHRRHVPLSRATLIPGQQAVNCWLTHFWTAACQACGPLIFDLWPVDKQYPKDLDNLPRPVVSLRSLRAPAKFYWPTPDKNVKLNMKSKKAPSKCFCA